jgi:rubrerythrin
LFYNDPPSSEEIEMEKRNLETVLKKAVLLERQSQKFYEDIAKRTENEAVRKVFTVMGAEEQGHEKTLLKQYKHFLSDGAFDNDVNNGVNVPDAFSERILSDSIIKEIETASYEGAAISAALGLEQNAVNLYRSEAEQADDAEEKRLFHDLADWEETHLQFLSNLHRNILQSSWFDGIE